MALKQNVIYIYFKGKHSVTSKSQYQYNHGQFLYFADLDLPQTFEVHFSNTDEGYAKPQIGSNRLVEIPDPYFWTKSSQIYAWIYLHEGTTDGETKYKVIINLERRSEPVYEEILPTQQTTIERAIAELNNAVDVTTENANKTGEDRTQVSNIKDEIVDLKEDIDANAELATEKAQEAVNASLRSEASAQNAAEYESNAHDYSDEAKDYAQQALESKTITSQKATIATDASVETLGYRDETLVAKNDVLNLKQDVIDYKNETKGYLDETKGVRADVQDIDNEVKDYASQAQASATSASQSATASANSASASAQSASEAQSASTNAETYALNSGNKAVESAQSAQASANSATQAQGYANSASASAQSASTSASAALTYANTASTKATEASTSAQTASTKATEAAQSATNASQSAQTAESAKTASQAAQGLAESARDSAVQAKTDAESAKADAESARDEAQQAVASISGALAEKAPVITDTASGSIASFSDGADDLPLKSLVIDINPVQDLSHGDPSPENICPISGWTEVHPNISGINVWDEECEIGSIDPTTGENVVAASRLRSKNYIPIAGGESYYFAFDNVYTSGTWFTIHRYGKDKEYLGNISPNKNAAATIADGTYYIRFNTSDSWGGATYVSGISINYPSTDHNYHPYTGRSITIDLGQTVYGGKLDVLSGELVMDRAMVDLGTLGWNYEPNYNRHGANFNQIPNIKIPESTIVPNALCSKYKIMSSANGWANRNTITAMAFDATFLRVYNDGTADATTYKTAMDGVQLCYELAEPITIQLTPNQVNSLLGVNNIWADSGDTEVEYRADTKLFIERLTAPDSADMIADANITSGQYFMVGNSLYKATANIANGAQIIVGTNCTRKSLSEALNEINA